MKGIYKRSAFLIVMATMLLVTVVPLGCCKGVCLLFFSREYSLPEGCWKSCAGPNESLWKTQIYPEERPDLLASRP